MIYPDRYIILVTGTREALTEEHREIVYDAINAAVCAAEEDVIFRHGGCPTGVDAFVASLVPDYQQQVRPADWGRFGWRAGPIRNQEMVTGLEYGTFAKLWEPPTVCLAFPKGSARGGGARGTIELCKGRVPTTVWTLS